MIIANSALRDLISNARSWNNWSHYLFTDWPLISTGADFENSLFAFGFCSNYTTIMSKTLKVTDNHVMYDRGAWFLTVIISRSRTLSCSPSVTKQKPWHHFQLCFVDRARHRKNSWRQGRHKTQNRPRRWQRSCLLIVYFYFAVIIFLFVQCIIRQLLDSVLVISRIIKLSYRSPIQTSIIFSWLILTLNIASWRSLNSHSVDFNYCFPGDRVTSTHYPLIG